jgi:hypothetical protein
MWEQAQKFEKNWWGTCTNTLGEELKQLTYAKRMGIKFSKRDGIPFIIDLQGKTVVDIGGGPNSLLLKLENGKGIVVDPCDYPNWVKERYWIANIEYIKMAAEDVPESILVTANEAWIYNCLQHTKNPEEIIRKAKLTGKVRIFEWIDAEVNEGHPHQLTEENLNKWLGGKGTVETLMGENECYGKCYYGTF